jgi:tetratricopeptide (TPR) repeat protein
MTLYDFSRQINTFKKSKQYEEVLHYFKENKQNFSTDQIAGNPYIIDGIITSLRKTEKVNFIDIFLKQYQIQINDTTHEVILTAYCWGLYEGVKNGLYVKQMIPQVLKYPIHLLSQHQSVYAYGVISNLLKLGLKIAKEHVTQDYLFTNDFCDLFSPDTLSMEQNIYEWEGKRNELASDREKWYSEKSKALFELNRFEECYKISDKALHEIDKFHNNNNLWFVRRMALSQKELGNLDAAIEKLQDVYNRKKEWFIQKEIAELYFEKGDTGIALKNCVEALNAKAPIEFKIGLIFLMGKILKSKNDTALGQQHFMLVKKIREEKEWKVPEEVLNEIGAVEDSTTRKELQNELERYWRAQIPKKEMNHGVIKKILNDNERGKNGFVASDNGEDFYFTIPSHIKFIDKIEQGVSVKFEILELPDGKTKAKIVQVNNTL